MFGLENTRTAAQAIAGKDILAKTPQSSFAFRTMTGMWLVFVIALGALMQLHAAKPGANGAPPLKMSQASLHHSVQLPSLLIFAHPYCPCFRTTLGELEEIMQECPGLVSARVIFVVPPGEEIDWESNENLEHVRSIAGVTYTIDEAAAETIDYGAETSGMTLLFDQQGNRVFAGGITILRGHAGDNLGRQAVVSFVKNGAITTNQASIYGCPLFDESSSDAQKVGR